MQNSFIFRHAFILTLLALTGAFFPMYLSAETVTPFVLGSSEQNQTAPSSRAQTTYTLYEGAKVDELMSIRSPEELPLIDERVSRVKFRGAPQSDSAPPVSQKVRILFEAVAVIPGPASLEVIAQAINTLPSSPEILVQMLRPQRLVANALVAGLRKFPIESPLERRDLFFELTGKTVPIKHTSLYRDPYGYDDGAPVFDMVNGEMTVSGVCENVYYTILVYKDGDDYLVDPLSYLESMRYLCVGNEYSFKLSLLPDHMRDGTYFLLVADQGEEAAWRPISDLTEISIKGKR